MNPDAPGRAQFSVCQFFREPAGSYEYVLRFVSAAEAIECAIRLMRSVGGEIGTTQRVIVTDGGDNIGWEWQYGEGLVYPTRQMLAEAGIV